MRSPRAACQVAVLALVGVLLAGCAGAFDGSPDPNAALPYPGSCATFDLSARRCDFIVRKVERDMAVAPAQVQRVELLGDPGCGQPRSCVRTVSFVVRVRVTTAGGPKDQMVFCMVGDQYSLICGDHPEVEVFTTADGYRDVPGDATPVSRPDPIALANAKPLRLDSFIVPIDHIGSYDVLVGHAILPNGILTAATVASVQIGSPDVVLDGPIDLVVVPQAGFPPFDNYYVRGWHPGTEDVTVRVQFSMSEPPAEGKLTLSGILVQ